jgi:hypothetical protein
MRMTLFLSSEPGVDPSGEIAWFERSASRGRRAVKFSHSELVFVIRIFYSDVKENAV